MKNKFVAGLALGLLLTCMGGMASATQITLDADSAATGSLLQSTPLTTSLGTITFTGEIRDRDGDPEFTAAGASGDVFDIGGTSGGSWAALTFSFDVSSISFIYGGNGGGINLLARDQFGATLDSFYQASTESEPAGPVTLEGLGIRSLYWEDPGWSFAALDNIEITAGAAPVPEPATMLLFGIGLAGLAGARLRRKKQ